MKSAELSKKVMSNEIHDMREAVNIILHLLKIECEKIRNIAQKKTVKEIRSSKIQFLIYSMNMTVHPWPTEFSCAKPVPQLVPSDANTATLTTSSDGKSVLHNASHNLQKGIENTPHSHR